MHAVLMRLAAALAAALLPLGASAEIVTIVHVNDTHSHLDSFGPKGANLDGTLGGLARAATVVRQIEATSENVVFLHAGDFAHGDLYWNLYAFGAAELQILSTLGLDAVAVGNHEFDATPDGLAAALRCAFAVPCGFGDPRPAFPVLSANAVAAGTVLEPWIQPRTIVATGGLRVGVFGMTNPDLPNMLNDPVEILGAWPDFNTLVGIAAEQAALLRAEGADLVVMLSHVGFVYDQLLAAYVPGIDVVVGAHDHYLFDAPRFVGTTPIVQAGEHYGHVGKLTLDVSAGGVGVLGYELVPVDASVPRDPLVGAWVDALQAGIVERYGDVYRTPVATAAVDVPKAFDPAGQARDTPIGNLVTDSYRWTTGTDLGITANGLLEVGLWAGPIVGADLFRVVSYGYDPPTGLGLRIATFETSGADLLRGLEASLSFLGVNDDFLLQVSGMRFAYDPRRPVGERVVPGSVHVNGRPIDPAAAYTATVNTGLLFLLPEFGVEVRNARILGTEYEALRDYVAKRGVLDTGSQNRIRDVSARGEE